MLQNGQRSFVVFYYFRVVAAPGPKFGLGNWTENLGWGGGGGFLRPKTQLAGGEGGARVAGDGVGVGEE